MDIKLEEWLIKQIEEKKKLLQQTNRKYSDYDAGFYAGMLTAYERILMSQYV